MTYEILIDAVVFLGGIMVLIVPILNLNKSITTLSITMDFMNEHLAEQTARNKASHERIWDYNEKQDARLDNHEERIRDLEKSEVIINERCKKL